MEDNFDEMLKVFEGDTYLQGQICESSTSVSFFYNMIMVIIFIYSTLRQWVTIAI